MGLRPARGDGALEASHVRVGDGGCPRYSEPGFSHLRKQLLPRLGIRDLHGAPQGEVEQPRALCDGDVQQGGMASVERALLGVPVVRRVRPRLVSWQKSIEGVAIPEKPETTMFG